MYVSGIPFWLLVVAHPLPHCDLGILVLAYIVLGDLHILHMPCFLDELAEQKLKEIWLLLLKKTIVDFLN